MRQMMIVCSHWATNVSECLSDSIVSGACRTKLVGVAAALFPRLTCTSIPSQQRSHLARASYAQGHQIRRRGHQFRCCGAGSPGPCPSPLNMTTETGRRQRPDALGHDCVQPPGPPNQINRNAKDCRRQRKSRQKKYPAAVIALSANNTVVGEMYRLSTYNGPSVSANQGSHTAGRVRVENWRVVQAGKLPLTRSAQVARACSEDVSTGHLRHGAEGRATDRIARPRGPRTSTTL